MTDLVDQMFPPVNRSAQPEFTDFNYWRSPLPKVDLPDFTPASPKSPTPSESSRYSLRRITSSITRRPSEVSTAMQPSKAASGPTSPLQGAILVEEEPEQMKLGESSIDSNQRRYRSDSMPGSYEDESPLADQMHSHGQDSSVRRQAILQDKMQRDEDTVSVMSGEDEDGFPMDDMDFSSVPVRFFLVKSKVECRC